MQPTGALALPILALTVLLALARFSAGPLTIGPPAAALIGAALCLILGIVTPSSASQTLLTLVPGLGTVAALMAMAGGAGRLGLFEAVGREIAVRAGGNGRKLFTGLFVSGAVLATIFTNDVAVLVLTPIVYKILNSDKGKAIPPHQQVPFYFAVLYVSNLVGALTISNPINIVVAQFANIGFLEYAALMALPAFVSALITYAGLRLAFRNTIPDTLDLAPGTPVTSAQRRKIHLAATVMGLTLLGFVAGKLTGLPGWIVALAGAATMLFAEESKAAWHRMPGSIDWGALTFVGGIFIVLTAVRDAGATAWLAHWLIATAGHDPFKLSVAISLVAAVGSALFNNHPTAGFMVMTIPQLGLPMLQAKIMALAALIGGDLGPKMLPIGSLAALIWFRLLAERGIKISQARYIALGVPIALAAVLASVAVLDLELLLIMRLK